MQGFQIKVPYLCDLFLFALKGFGLKRMVKKSNWSVVSYKEKEFNGLGLEALLNLLDRKEAPSKSTKHGVTVSVHCIEEIAFSFTKKILRVKGKTVLVD